MNYIFDACSIIFLTNVNLLRTIISIPGKSWFVGQIVVDECYANGNTIPELELALSNGEITLLDGSNLDATKYLNNLNLYNLGEGETECLTYVAENDYIACIDDRKARKTISDLYGRDKTIGSLGLMKEGVQSNLLTAPEAMLKYNEMKSKGAFLPNIPHNFFD